MENGKLLLIKAEEDKSFEKLSWNDQRIKEHFDMYKEAQAKGQEIILLKSRRSGASFARRMIKQGINGDTDKS